MVPPNRDLYFTSSPDRSVYSDHIPERAASLMHSAREGVYERGSFPRAACLRFARA